MRNSLSPIKQAERDPSASMENFLLPQQHVHKYKQFNNEKNIFSLMGNRDIKCIRDSSSYFNTNPIKNPPRRRAQQYHSISSNTFTRNPYEDLEFMTIQDSSVTNHDGEGAKNKILRRLEQIQERQSQLLGIDVHRVQQESIRLLQQSNTFDLQKSSINRDSIYGNPKSGSTFQRNPLNTNTTWKMKNYYSSN